MDVLFLLHTVSNSVNTTQILILQTSQKSGKCCQTAENDITVELTQKLSPVKGFTTFNLCKIALTSNFQCNCWSWIILLVYIAQIECNTLESCSIPIRICILHPDSGGFMMGCLYEFIACRYHTRHVWDQCYASSIWGLDLPQLTTCYFSENPPSCVDRCSSAAVEHSWATTGEAGVSRNHQECLKQERDNFYESVCTQHSNWYISRLRVSRAA